MQYDPNSDRYNFSTNVSAEDIKQYFREHNEGPFFSIFEIGINGIRLDMLRVEPSIKYIRGFEFKVSRSDFLADKKWEKYLKYCNTFSFVCPYGMIAKKEIPTGIGLLWIDKWSHKSHIGNDRQHLDAQWIKRTKRRSMSKDTMIEMAMMLTYKVKWRRQDIF